ncbi:MAG: phosphoribosylglycinamide formyltransferase [Candidatus Omnitrophica bacterium]|nr:phosphoribosylglycinamide formyltransferase [Candidatus Omnitrophota bacterium]
MKFAVFVSGVGSNLKVLHDACKKGEIKSELALVFSNRPKAGGIKYAQEVGLETLHLNPKDYTNPQSFDRDVVIHLKQAKIDFIVTAGYMKLFTPYFVKQYPNKIINVHPSLLPAFKGKQGIKDAFTYGVKVAGVTIHFVNDKMDAGPIILQQPVDVSDDETLESLTEKIHKIEHKIFKKAIALYEQDRLKVKAARRVEIRAA